MHFLFIGSIKTGCQATSEQRSRYCSQHKLQVCNLTTGCEDAEAQTLDAAFGPSVRTKKGDMAAEMILATKSTRTQTYYKVLAPSPEWVTTRL